MQAVTRRTPWALWLFLWGACSGNPPPVTCTVGTMVACNSTCVDLKTDLKNCGYCGRACLADETCVAGACAKSCSGMLCGGACVDIASDDKNCGECGRACPAGQLCSNSACGCSGVDKLCGGACVDTGKDQHNCGDCGKVCPAAQSCVKSACACPGTMKACGDSCFDLKVDPGHCGDCNKACLAEQQCNLGTCVLKDFGTGADGPLSVMTGTQTINTVRTSASATAGTSTVELGDGTGFAAGQTVLLHQSQGMGAGTWELALVKKVDGKTATLTDALVNSYRSVTGGAAAQALVVPQYSDVTVAAGATLTAPPWDGAAGGLLAFMANGTVSVAGTVSMSGAGYRGYTGHVMSCVTRACDAGAINGYYGEDSTGPAQASGRTDDGHGRNNGGGGGGGGTRGQDCASGGGGGYGTAGGAGADGSLGVCLFGGTHGGGLAGKANGDKDLLQDIYFGAAGGEGGQDEDGAQPGVGGNGGGIVMLFARNLAVTGSVATDGARGGDGNNSGTPYCGGAGCGMGGGGGGAGGAIRIVAGKADIGTALLSAQGVGGGNCTCGGYLPGGSGGAGRIQIKGMVSGTSNPPYEL